MSDNQKLKENIRTPKEMEQDKKYLCDDSQNKSNCSTPQETPPMKSVGWTWLLILAGLASTIGSSIPIGFSIGVLNAPSGLIQKWINGSVIERYDMVLNSNQMDILWSSIVSIFLVGGMVGSLSGAWFADNFGRKGTLVIGGVTMFSTSVMFVLTKPLNSLELFFLGRLVAGLSGGLIMTVVPMYLTELAPIQLRGAMGTMCPMGISSGVLLAQILGLPVFLGTEEIWPYLLGFFGVLVLVGYSAFPWLPESPKYLYVIRGSRQGALRELSRLRNLPEEFVCCELEEKTESTEEEIWTLRRLMRTRSLWINLALVCALHFGQQFSGINAVFYYSVTIFRSAGLSEQNAQLGNLAAGVINLGMGIGMIPTINLFSRRFVTITSCTLATAFLVFLSFSIRFIHSFTWMPYLSVVGVLGYVLTYGFGLGPIPYFIGTELFDVGPRPLGMALGTASNWLGNLTVGFFFPVVQSAIGPYSFLIFATSTALLTIFVKVCLVETNVIILAKRQRNSSLSKA
ncbi:solute carrier family 2, facilitated glucose transporter member 5 isoform X2 [Halyomorpha halys]|uniref:solute carrier family 2, facilitated glucose transporter member 5 isoform X2 n=1 Tax=Halyomorpha halys TaxID=286706 RepID=UPI0006D51FF5|nr:solute carrier family 2, facilitated glucose transporter member 5-like isoform X1 [Halyomorpha halys]